MSKNQLIENFIDTKYYEAFKRDIRQRIMGLGETVKEAKRIRNPADIHIVSGISDHKKYFYITSKNLREHAKPDPTATQTTSYLENSNFSVNEDNTFTIDITSITTDKFNIIGTIHPECIFTYDFKGNFIEMTTEREAVSRFIYHRNEGAEALYIKRHLKNKIIQDSAAGAKRIKYITPRKIKEELDKHVIGQEEVKKALSSMCYYYMQSVYGKTNTRQSDWNSLIIGDTGSGKTLMMKTLAGALDIPMISVDATTLTTVGYKGNDVNDILRPLLAYIDNNNRNQKSVVNGIVFIDEFDKLIAKKNYDNTGNTIQHEFLKMIEGKVVTLEEFEYSGVNASIDTSNLMFVFGGSFPKIKDIISERLGETGNIKLPEDDSREKIAARKDQLLSKVTHSDLIKFGVNREFLGRVPVIRAMESITKEMLLSILKEPKNSVYNQYKEKLAMMGIDFSITEDAANYIVERGLENNTGARGLDNIIAQIMEDAMYKIPGKKNIKRIEIDKKAVIQNSAKIICGRQKKQKINAEMMEIS